MEQQLIFTICATLALLSLVLMAACIPWTTHRTMTKEYAKKGLINASYKQFEKEFEKIEWKRNPVFPDSLYHFDSDSELHASIFRINGIGMKMRTPYSFAKAKRFIKNKLSTEKYEYLSIFK